MRSDELFVSADVVTFLEAVSESSFCFEVGSDAERKSEEAAEKLSCVCIVMYCFRDRGFCRSAVLYRTRVFSKRV